MASVLETVLTMPLQEMRMWTIHASQWGKSETRVMDERSHTLVVVHLPGNQDLQIICQADQPSIKHPMRCSRQRNPVADDVGAASFDGADMRRSDLSTATPIDELEPSNRAT